MIETEVHSQLKAYLRAQVNRSPWDQTWPHHLTLARLVARALRLGRSALIQVGTAGYGDSHRLSYLMALLLWPGSALVVAPEPILEALWLRDLPQLQQWLNSHKAVHRWAQGMDDRFAPHQVPGLWLLTPTQWLTYHHQTLRDPAQPWPALPTILEAVDDLEDWILTAQTTRLEPSHWLELQLADPQQRPLIQEAQIRLTHWFFKHPPNPYQAYLLDDRERDYLQTVLQTLQEQRWTNHWPQPWDEFYHRLHQNPQALWVELDRPQGRFHLLAMDLNSRQTLQNLWPRQPLILIQETQDSPHKLEPGKPSALLQRFGWPGDLTQVQFSPDRREQQIQLYLPQRLPLPNTPTFKAAVLEELRRLLVLGATGPMPTVILVQDTPLKEQVAATLAADFGSRVQVEQLPLGPSGILITGWPYWLRHCRSLPNLSFLIITTLPFPSLEHPQVAARVNHHKRQGQDWFQAYLLPQALRDLQRAIAPVRANQGIITLLDTRLIHRSYGQKILATLSPFTRLSQLDPSLFDESLDR